MSGTLSSSNPFVVADAPVESRVYFIRQVYTHVAGAWLVFFLFEALLLSLDVTYAFTGLVLSLPFGWLGVMGALMGVGWMARILVTGGLPRSYQYVGLAAYVLAEAVVFAPLIIITLTIAGPHVLIDAVILSGALFAGLTAVVFVTRKDFSFLGSILTVAGCVSLGLIVCSILFGFNLGLVFSAAMIVVAGGAILYDTSRIIHDHKPDEYVAAALELFASMALMLWYVIRMCLAFGRRD